MKAYYTTAYQCSIVNIKVCLQYLGNTTKFTTVYYGTK